MKNLIYTLIVCFLLSYNSNAQWIQQTSGTTQGLYTVHFLKQNFGWTAGKDGTILKTTDGGENWFSQSISTSDNIRSIIFTDSLNGWIALYEFTPSRHGSVYHSTDGGINWSLQLSISGFALLSLSFTDNLNGWVVGTSGISFRTTNGGNTWLPMSINTNDGWLQSVRFVNNNDGWAAGDIFGQIAKTTDGGNYWFMQNLPTNNYLIDVYFINQSFGWGVGQAGTIVRTTNGGSNWLLQPSGVTNELRDVQFVNEQKGWAASIGGEIINSTDGGVTWFTQYSSSTIDLYALSFVNGSTGWAVGDNGIILKYIITAPEIPSLFSPANLSINQQLNQTFSWYSSPRAEHYHLQISLDSLFSTFVLEDSVITDTMKSNTTLNYNNLYYWRVKGKNDGGVSNWSSVWRFNAIVKSPEINLTSGGGQITLNWIQDPNNNISIYKIFRDTIPAATTLLAIVDSNQFSYIDIDFTENRWYYYRIKSVNIYGLESDFSNEVSGIPIQTFQLSVYIDNNWNIVSIPGLLANNQNVTTWWPGKDPAANVFKYQGSYQSVTTVEPGIGYWMKHTGSNLYNTGEEWPTIGIQLVSHNPINATAGWNLIGGYEDTVSTAMITTTPPGLRTGPMFRYFDGYWIADYIEPGYGYWIKLTGAGQINIPQGSSDAPSIIVKNATDGFGKITITDNTGKSYTLYAVKGEVDLNQYELPPVPPQGLFDIRYSSQRYVERLGSNSQSIEMLGVKHPVRVKVEGIEIILSDESGKEIGRLKDGDEVSITSLTNKLMVTENIIPSVYSLEQNYPNPFNPNTVIEFSLPENAGNVKLSVYNTLGEKVAEIVNTTLVAGKYSYQWNASNVSTGMYIYELRTDKFVSTKKMILLK